MDEKIKGILLSCNFIKFPLVKVIVRKIAYKDLITTKLWGRIIEVSFRKFFQRLRGCIMFLKLVQIDQGYQWQQLPSDLDSYRRRYWSIFKTATLFSLKNSHFMGETRNLWKYRFRLPKGVKIHKIHPRIIWDSFSMILVKHYIEKYENVLKFTFHDFAAHLKGFVSEWLIQ